MLGTGEEHDFLIRVQNNLFNVCTHLATDQSQTPLYPSAHLAEGEIELLEKRIDEIMRKDPDIDAIILGCTHYPLLMPKILKYLPTGVRVVSQGEYVAESLKSYLERHPQIEKRCAQGAGVHYLTTENPDKFKESARLFLHEDVEVENITLG